MYRKLKAEAGVFGDFFSVAWMVGRIAGAPHVRPERLGLPKYRCAWCGGRARL